MAALVDIDDLGFAVTCKSLFDDFLGMVGLQCDGNLVGQYQTAGYVHHRCEINESRGHRNVGRVQGLDLIGTHDEKIAQQVGIDLVTRSSLAGHLPRMRLIHDLTTCIGLRTKITTAPTAAIKPCHNSIPLLGSIYAQAFDVNTSHNKLVRITKVR